MKGKDNSSNCMKFLKKMLIAYMTDLDKVHMITVRNDLENRIFIQIL
jgi:hypothetical protein